MINFVTFDLDGTMIDDEWAHEQAKREIAWALGAAGDLNLSYFTGRSNRLFWSMVCDRCGEDKTRIEELTKKQFLRVLELLKEAKQPESIGLTDTLRYLHKKGYKVAVTSGSDEFFVDGILAHLNVKEYIDVKITKDFVRQVKPDPDIYLAAMREAGMRPEESLGVEDSLSGCQALKRAGMLCLGYSNRGMNPQNLEISDYIIPTMTDMLPVLERLGR